MGTFRVGCQIENIADRSRSAKVSSLLVDTGSDYTWLPENVLEKIGVAREKKDIQLTMANGQLITRSVGFVIIKVDKFFTVDEVVFAEKGERNGDAASFEVLVLRTVEATIDKNGRRMKRGRS